MKSNIKELIEEDIVSWNETYNLSNDEDQCYTSIKDFVLDREIEDLFPYFTDEEVAKINEYAEGDEYDCNPNYGGDIDDLTNFLWANFNITWKDYFNKKR